MSPPPSQGLWVPGCVWSIDEPGRLSEQVQGEPQKTYPKRVPSPGRGGHPPALWGHIGQGGLGDPFSHLRAHIPCLRVCRPQCHLPPLSVIRVARKSMAQSPFF